MTATWQDGDARMLFMLGQPDTDYPARETRFEWQLMTADALMKEATRSGKPHLIGSFALSISASELTKVIPVDDFEALFTAYDTATNRPIPVINFTDAERWGVTSLPNTIAAGSVLAIGWRGVGDEKRIVVYPQGATANLTVFYMKTIDQSPNPQAAIEILDGFDMVLVPAAVALYGMPFWRWSNLSAAERDRRVAMLQSDQNPMSLVNVYKSQWEFFRERVYNPHHVFTTDRPTSTAGRHQLMRALSPWRN